MRVCDGWRCGTCEVSAGMDDCLNRAINSVAGARWMDECAVRERVFVAVGAAFSQ